ncbi:MAG TPA: methylglyoxal synthase [Bacteroidales bacterium]|jgi:methylglyoxal synthase|nr:methylglyoxal synthase [Bacteroidales bacterium]HPY80699.1 methylglyoxal synthase [Bacteroidales bacterium]HQA87310.1 methylglyoxal synthase [Bacteroidales bacterium]HRR03981.1 methylglyoxal synthase [Bacteroidales bacterium]HRT14367.1 methylglyoxal synthase [Bacteroidales bacterium]
MTPEYTIALVAHDNCKNDLIEWVAFNKEKLKQHKLVCTGTTGKLVEAEINKNCEKGSRDYIRITKLKSGPLGGDQQLGAMIAENKIDFTFFFWDPMAQQPHDVDVKALLRITVLYNVPTACNRTTADFLISSSLFENGEYEKKIYDYTDYTKRKIKLG